MTWQPDGAKTIRYLTRHRATHPKGPRFNSAPREVGFKQAVAECNSGDPIAPDIAKPPYERTK
jgi:hypothetical protein